MSVKSMNSSNNKKDEVPELLEDEKELDAIIDADFSVPIKPKWVGTHTTKTKGYRFYLEVRPKLREWWDEFNTAQNDRGGCKYRTAFSFARAKGRNDWERQLIWEMIGTRPAVGDKTALRVPWLGDWQLRRANGFWAPENPKKLQALAKAVKEKLQQWEAVRCLAPALVLDWARAERMFEKLEGYYQGEFMNPDTDPDSDENQARANRYLTLAGRILEYKIKVWDQWMAVHGVDPRNPVCQVQVNSITQQLGNPAGELENLPQYEIQAIRLHGTCRHMQGPLICHCRRACNHQRKKRRNRWRGSGRRRAMGSCNDCHVDSRLVHRDGRADSTARPACCPGPRLWLGPVQGRSTPRESGFIEVREEHGFTVTV
jgi:hypothetical protein